VQHGNQREGPNGYPQDKSDAEGNFVLLAVDKGSLLRARKGRSTTIAPVTTRGGPEEVTLVLHHNAFSTVAVHVQQEDGKPIGGVMVNLMIGPKEWYVYPIDERRTGADGICIFKSIDPDGFYKFGVKAKGYGTGGGDKINLEPGKRVEVGPVILKRADSFVA